MSESTRHLRPNAENFVKSRSAPRRPSKIKKFVGSIMMPSVLDRTKNTKTPSRFLVQRHKLSAPKTQSSKPMTHHHLKSGPETCHWGFFEARLSPVLTINSGDEITIETISGGPDVVPDRSK